MLKKIKSLIFLLKNFKEWYDGLNSQQQENYKVVLIIFMVFLIFGVAMTTDFSGGKKHHKRGEKTIVCNDPAHQGIITESPTAYADTVFAIAVHNGTTYRNSHSYTEIIFGHDLYLYYREKSGEIKHYNYNSPVYVTEGDLCVVWVEKKGEKESVTLVENLSKKDMTIIDAYWDNDLEDRD